MPGTVPVAARVTGLCLDAAGHLRDNDYLAMAARGGLLVDLAVAQRLTQTEDSIELDSAPTGWPPTDQAVTELGLLDGRSLDWWLEHSRLTLDDLAAALVSDGSWARLPARVLHRTPRYAVRGTAVLARDRALLTQSEPSADTADVAVVAIAVAAGLAKDDAAASAADALVYVADSAGWVCQLVTDFIRQARVEGTAVSGASRAALWSGMPY